LFLIPQDSIKRNPAPEKIVKTLQEIHR